MVKNIVRATNIVRVKTPQGYRAHGLIEDGVFKRTVRYDVDRMKIFDAWSLHPDALARIEEMGVKTLEYYDVTNDEIYRLGVGSLIEMLSGLTKSPTGNQLAFIKTFGGGETIYIKLEAFVKVK